MTATQPESRHIDFANDEVPNLHTVLEDLRGRYAIAPVQDHGEISYMMRFGRQ